MKRLNTRYGSAVLSMAAFAAGAIACGGSAAEEGQAAQDVTPGAAMPGADLGMASHSEANTATVFASLWLFGKDTLTIGPMTVHRATHGGGGGVDHPFVDVDVRLGDLRVLRVEGAESNPKNTKSSTSVTADGQTNAGDVTMLNGLVVLRNLVAESKCEATATGRQCKGTMSVSELTVGGKKIPLLEIAPNTKLRVKSLLAIPGLDVKLPVDLELVLNEQLAWTDAVPSTNSLIVNVAHLSGAASIDGLVSLMVDVVEGGPSATVGEPVTQCNSGSLQCCNSIQSANSDAAGAMIPPNAGGLTGSLGLDCSPMNVLGTGSSGCNAQPACCSGDTYGTVTLACNPVALDL
ncbi:hydrophobin family protein [Pendulispora rubella]|uniref:Hydrophobin family protein n=1 Tax=Pendulispora rubella TaxID=2741070 RepID=A0ABZ2LLZ0_9BACT